MTEIAEAIKTDDLYESDFFEWTRQQASLLRERRFDKLDLENLIDEVESVGSSERREIRNRLTVLLCHLLRWKYQPGLRGDSWLETIDEQRRMLQDIVTTSPSLRSYLHVEAGNMYRSGRLEASRQTRIALGVFPKANQFTPEQVMNPDFLPEDWSFE